LQLRETRLLNLHYADRPEALPGQFVERCNFFVIHRTPDGRASSPSAPAIFHSPPSPGVSCSRRGKRTLASRSRSPASPAPLFRKGDRNARGQGLAEFRILEPSSRLDIATDNASGITKANGERRFLLRGTLLSSSSSTIKRVRIIAAFTSPSSSSDHEGVGFVTRHADERSLHLQRACGRDATHTQRERERERERERVIRGGGRQIARREEIKVFFHGRSRARRFDDSAARMPRDPCTYREGDNVFKVRPVGRMVG